MELNLYHSVGRGGANDMRDVKLVQLLLNCQLPKGCQPMAVDGRCGNKTIATITAFQRHSLNYSRPDGRIDPSGKSIRTLLAGYEAWHREQIRAVITGQVPWRAVADSITNKVKSFQDASNAVVYSPSIANELQLVSAKSKKIIRDALREAGMQKAVITETIRTARQQAEIMYRNASINLKSQLNMYSAGGDEILAVFSQNKALAKTECIDLMTEKAQEVIENGKFKSAHVVTVEKYRTRNAIDIGCNSTRAANPGCYHPDKFTKALREMEESGVIAKLIDERGKSNSCWHLEIVNGG